MWQINWCRENQEFPTADGAKLMELSQARKKYQLVSHIHYFLHFSSLITALLKSRAALPSLIENGSCPLTSEIYNFWFYKFYLIVNV